ncbi:hypothetical protein ACF0H5_006113 [Mactra antiquata]
MACIIALLVFVTIILVYKCRGKVTHIKQTTINGDFINQQTNIFNQDPEESNATELSVFNTERNDNDSSS